MSSIKMPQPSKTLRKWTSETITLIVGPDKERFTVPQGVLEQIVYFRAALGSGTFTEAQNRTFLLPDEDPEVMAEVIEYASSGSVITLSDVIDVDTEETADAKTHKVMYMIKVYILEDRWNMEKMVYDIIDAFNRNLLRSWQGWIDVSKCLAELRKVHSNSSALYRFLVWRLKEEVMLVKIPWGVRDDYSDPMREGDFYADLTATDWFDMCIAKLTEDPELVSKGRILNLECH